MAENAKEADKFVKSYINASYLNGLVKDFSRKSLIAAMAPNEISLARFWLMIFQQKVQMIVMLCPLVSYTIKNDVKKEVDESISYWKNLETEDESVYIEGDGYTFQLSLVSKVMLNQSITHRRFKLELVGSKEQEAVSSPYFDRPSFNVTDEEKLRLPDVDKSSQEKSSGPFPAGTDSPNVTS